jgi:hypothetical protein
MDTRRTESGLQAHPPLILLSRIAVRRASGAPARRGKSAEISSSERKTRNCYFAFQRRLEISPSFCFQSLTAISNRHPLSIRSTDPSSSPNRGLGRPLLKSKKRPQRDFRRDALQTQNHVQTTQIPLAHSCGRNCSSFAERRRPACAQTGLRRRS